MLAFVVAFCYFNVVTDSAFLNPNTFELNIIHFNDFHSRFEPINEYAVTCKNKEFNCIGGFSRLYSSVMKRKREKPNAIILNAGDNFQGSLWYTFYKWKAIVHFLNKLPIDAQTLGNHEFDDGIDGLVPLLRNLDAVTVVSNIDDQKEPNFQNVYRKSVVISRSGRKIGVIGVITTKASETTRSGKLKFLNEVESVNKEAKRLVLEYNVDTIIVLSHCGYMTDQEIAKKAAPRISLIVGGHSHSLLSNGAPPDSLTVEGPYPTVITSISEQKVLIVQASGFTRFTAYIDILYSNDGKVISWSGTPIYLNKDVPTDPAIDKEIEEWKKGVDGYGGKTLGTSLVLLDRSSCYDFECNLGNFVTDAMLYTYRNRSIENDMDFANIAIINSGFLRNSINVGNVTVRDLLEAIPYYNNLDVGDLQGKYIKEALEHAVLLYHNSRNLLQVSGLRVVYNTTKPQGSQVEEVQVYCQECVVPRYENMQTEKFYRVVLIRFLVLGGDGYSAIAKNLINHKIGKVVQEAVQDYLVQKSPINQMTEGRIKFVK